MLGLIYRRPGGVRMEWRFKIVEEEEVYGYGREKVEWASGVLPPWK